MFLFLRVGEGIGKCTNEILCEEVGDEDLQTNLADYQGDNRNACRLMRQRKKKTHDSSSSDIVQDDIRRPAFAVAHDKSNGTIKKALACCGHGDVRVALAGKEKKSKNR